MKICNVKPKTKFTLLRNGQEYYLIGHEALTSVVRTHTGQIIKLDKTLDVVIDT